MSSTFLQQLKAIGESMGLKGPELMNSVRDQQTLERKERDRSRGRKKSKTKRRKMSGLKNKITKDGESQRERKGDII